MSCSSAMSPTISSRMSSSVTRPCTSPYSSTTSAMWVLRLRKALSWSLRLVVSGTNHGLVADGADVDPAQVSPPAALDRAQQILGVDDADDVLRLVSQSGHAGVGGRQDLVDDLVRRLVGVDRVHVGAVDHDVGRPRARRSGRGCGCTRPASLPSRRARPRPRPGPSISASVRISCCGASWTPSRRRIAARGAVEQPSSAG